MNSLKSKPVVRTLGALLVLVFIGSWLMGIWGWEIRVGSHVLGRRIGIDEEETWFSLLGWLIATFSIVASIIVLYRTRN